MAYFKKIATAFCILTAVMVSSCKTATPTENTGSQNETMKTPMIIAQLTDPQIGFVDYDAELARFRREINILNRSDCEAVVICGDMMHRTHRKNMEIFKKELSRLKRPVFLVPGNHDIAYRPDSRTQWLEMFGPAFYAADLPNRKYRLVVLDTELWQHPTDETAKMDVMFLEELAAARKNGRRIVLAAHAPIFVESANEPEKYYNLPMARREWLIRHLAGSPVIAYLSGHTHTSFAFVWKNILFSSGDNTSVTFDKLGHGFRRIVFDGEWTRFCTVPVEKPLPTPSVSIPFLGEAPRLDGVLDDGIWKEAAEITLLRHDGTIPPENDRATLRIGWTNDALVIGAACRSQKPLEPSPSLKLRDDRVFESNDVLEFFLGNSDWSAYRHLALDFEGHFWDAPPKEELASTWNPEWKFAIKRLDDCSWTAEIIIPFKELWNETNDCIKPAKGLNWRVNFCREHRKGGPMLQSWNPPGFHDPDAFGNLVFTTPND